MSDLNCYRLREIAVKVEPHMGNSFSFSDGNLLCYYAGFNLSKFALHVGDHVEAVYREATDQLASPGFLTEMPSSLNDACRKLDIAASEIARLRTQVEYWRLAAERREARRDRSGLDIAEASTLDAPQEEPNEVNDTWARGEHVEGVTR